MQTQPTYRMEQISEGEDNDTQATHDSMLHETRIDTKADSSNNGGRAARFYEPPISNTSHFDGYMGSLRRMSNIETNSNTYYPRKESATRKVIK